MDAHGSVGPGCESDDASEKLGRGDRGGSRSEQANRVAKHRRFQGGIAEKTAGLSNEEDWMIECSLLGALDFRQRFFFIRIRRRRGWPPPHPRPDASVRQIPLPSLAAAPLRK